MLNKLTLLTIVVFISTAELKSQDKNTGSDLRNYNLLDQGRNGLNVYDMMRVTPYQTEVNGDAFYEGKDFIKGSITLNANETFYDNLQIRYNVQLNTLEFQVDTQIKSLDAKLVKKMILQNTSDLSNQKVFINAKSFLIGNKNEEFLLEVLYEGKTSLYKRRVASVLKGHYIPQLGAESQNNTIVKKDVIYYKKDNQLIELPKKSKEIFKIFGNQQVRVKEYCDKNKLKLPRDIATAVSYFDTL